MNKKITDTKGTVQGARNKVQGLNLHPFFLHREPHPSKGFTLVELVIVVSLVGVLAGMFFERVWFYQEMAEKAAMQQVVSTLQTALILEYGHRMTLNMGYAVNDIGSENPMAWLSQKPVNYVGDIDGMRTGAIELGNWAFDIKSRELIYAPKHNEYFVPAQNGEKWIRYRARFVYNAIPGNRGQANKELSGVIFASVQPYQWVIPERK